MSLNERYKWLEIDLSLNTSRPRVCKTIMNKISIKGNLFHIEKLHIYVS